VCNLPDIELYSKVSIDKLVLIGLEFELSSSLKELICLFKVMSNKAITSSFPKYNWGFRIKIQCFRKVYFRKFVIDSSH